MTPSVVERSAGNDAHLFLVPISLLAVALGLCSLLLVLQVMPTTSATGPAAEEEAPVAASLPPSA